MPVVDRVTTPVIGRASWGRSVDRAMLLGALFVMMIQVLPAISALLAPGGAKPALVVLVASQLSVAACCLTGLRRGHAAGLAFPAAVAAAIGIGVVVAADLPQNTAQLLPTNAVQAIQIVAIVFIIRQALAVGFVLITGPVFVWMRQAAGDVTAWGAIDEWVLPTASSIAIIAVVGHLRAGANYADRLRFGARAQAKRAARAMNGSFARDEARRSVHDEVITTLRAIEMELAPAQVRRSCRRTVEALNRQHSRSTLAEVMDEVVTAAPVSVAVDSQIVGASPPPRVVAALHGAIAEALRNVKRHAGVADAEMSVRASDARVEVEVRDAGVGINGTAPGYGTQRSIIERMESVGGSAEVRARLGDGSGTTVALRWPRVDPVEEADQSLPVLRDRTRVVLLVGAASAVANLYLAIRYPGQSLPVALAVWAGVTAILLGVAVISGHGRDRRPAWISAVLAVWALTAVGLIVANDGALQSVESWVVGYAAIVLAILAFDLRLRNLVIAVAGQLGVVVLHAAVDPELSAYEPIGALVTPVVVAGLGAVLGAALRRGSREIRQAEALWAARADEQSWRVSYEQAREVHLGHVAEEVVPFLQDVLDGVAMRPAESARLLSAQCRDELYLTEPIPEATRRAIRTARESGVVVAVRAPTGEGTIPAAGWAMLELVLAHAPEGSWVTVAPPLAGSVGRQGRIVCVPPIPDLPTHARHDAGRTTVLVSSDLVSSDQTTGAEPVASDGMAS